MTRAIILLVFLPGIFGFLSRKFLLCNQSSISPLFLDSSSQNLSISLCNRTFDLVIQTNENFFSPNISIDKSIKFQTKRRFAYIGSLENDDESSSVSFVIPIYKSSFITTEPIIIIFH